MNNRIFAIPDIHGRKDLLDQLLSKLHTEHDLDLSTDKLVFLGDMIDRGSDSKGVLDAVFALQDQHGADRVVALAGNHEWLMIDGIAKSYDEFYLWMINGGNTTLKSFPGERVPEEYIKRCASLPLYHEEPGYFFSHAPLSIYHEREDEPLPFRKSALIWTYEDGAEEHWSHHHDGGVVGVCGHIHRLRGGITEPRMYDHYIFADCGSGCSKDAPLVAVDVRSRLVVYSRPSDLNKETK